MAATVLAAVWSGVGLVVQAAGARDVRPANVLNVAESLAVDAADREGRTQQIERLAQAVQRLSLDERLRPDVNEALRSSLLAMTPQEQRTFVDGVLPMGLEPMVAAYRAMETDRKRLVSDRLHRKFTENGWLAEETSPEDFAALLDAQAAQFLEHDAPDARLELLPMMQQMLKVMQTR